MIVEPVMMNAGIIRPLPGYLAGLRDLLHDHGALLTFDEVKTGLTVGPGGVTALSGVTPDLVCLAKSLGGGVSVAAVGGTAELMDHVADGGYEMVGTFNGNPLAMAAARAMLTEVATEAAYRRIEGLRQRAAAGITAAIDDYRTERARGDRRRQGLRRLRGRSRSATTAASSPSTTRCSHAHWLFQHNGGVFLPPWGKIEQWLISVQHDESDIDRLVANFRAFAAASRIAHTSATHSLPTKPCGRPGREFN